MEDNSNKLPLAHSNMEETTSNQDSEKCGEPQGTNGPTKLDTFLGNV